MITRKYVGLDVSKERIAVPVADGGSRESARYWGEIPHRIENIRKLIRRLGDVKQLQMCIMDPRNLDTKPGSCKV